MSDFMLMLKWKNKKKNIFSKSSKFKVQIMIDLETVICESGCMCVSNFTLGFLNSTDIYFTKILKLILEEFFNWEKIKIFTTLLGDSVDYV